MRGLQARIIDERMVISRKDDGKNYLDMKIRIPLAPSADSVLLWGKITDLPGDFKNQKHIRESYKKVRIYVKLLSVKK